MADEEPAEGGNRRYDSPVRRAGAAQTRERIIEAGVDLVRNLSSWDWRQLTVRAVAERSGVHERTIYRHFPTEPDLRGAVVQRLESDAGVTIEGLDAAGLTAHVTQLLTHMSSLASSAPRLTDPALLEIDERRKQAIFRALEDAAGADWTDGDVRLAAACLDVLWGVPSYRRFAGGWDLELDETLRAVAWLTDLVIGAVKTGQPPTVTSS